MSKSKHHCHFCGRGRTKSLPMRTSEEYPDRLYCVDALDCINEVPPGRKSISSVPSYQVPRIIRKKRMPTVNSDRAPKKRTTR